MVAKILFLQKTFGVWKTFKKKIAADSRGAGCDVQELSCSKTSFSDLKTPVFSP